MECNFPDAIYSHVLTFISLRALNNVHISNIENGKKVPSIDLLIELANALEISTDDLLVDSLTHSVSTADSEIHQMLVDCNKTEEEILTEMVRALKAILYRSGI